MRIEFKAGHLEYDALLLLTAGIWGFAFVAQRVGMQHVGPFVFNGIRFGLGALTLLPVIRLRSRSDRGPSKGRFLLSGLLAGAVLFCGASLQQIGIVYTTAGKSGFITGLYVVLVPLLGLLFGHRAGWNRWFGAVLAAAGLYFLSVTDNFTIARGDLLVFLSAFFWAAHVLIIAQLAPRHNAARLACLQYAVCSALSLIVGGAVESFEAAALGRAIGPILYGGVLSVGLAYTLQIVAQKKAHPAHAAIFLSLEGVFALLGGWLFLGETLTPRGYLGCGLMLTAMLVSQLSGTIAWNDRNADRRE